jgi:hypothetical protein
MSNNKKKQLAEYIEWSEIRIKQYILMFKERMGVLLMHQ